MEVDSKKLCGDAASIQWSFHIACIRYLMNLLTKRNNYLVSYLTPILI